MQNRVFTILIVEDEILAVQYLKHILKSLKYETVFVANNANDALRIVFEQTIDLVFMDINIQGAMDGIACARSINEKRVVPIIYTSAYSDSQTLGEASETNIFGYLIKPFEKVEVEALMHISLKRIKDSKREKLLNANETVYLAHNASFDMKNSSLRIGEVSINLTKKESVMMSVFCQNLNKIVSYEDLTQEVWKNKIIASSTIRDTISRLRKKVPSLHIESISGLGYILRSQ